MFRLFKNRKKPKIFIALTLVFLVLIAVIPNTTSAGVFTCLIGDPGEGLSTVASFISPAFAIVKGAFNLFGDNTSQTASCANQVLGFVFYLILQVFSILLSAVGILFNFVFEFTVIDMRANIEGIKIVNVGWSVVRDFANILFIFMLLYLAISTILQLDDHGVKHGLSRLIIGAVLINFSLFFVKVPIDVSNILATQIYNKINTPTANGILQGELGDGSGRIGLGDAFMNIFQFQKVFDGESNLSKNPVSTFVMSALLMFITALIFLAVAIIFIKRFIVLVMLMIFSPLAFAGMAVPNHDVEHQISHDFWSSLVKEAFYAPAFLFLVYLALTTGMALEGAPIKGSEELSAILPVGNIITYTVVMGMLIFALTVSEKIGVKGASGAIGMFDGMRGFATGWVGRNTLGRVGDTLLNKGNTATNLREAAAGLKGKNAFSKFAYTQLGKAGIAVTSGLSSNKFGGSESYAERVHDRETAFKNYTDETHNDPKEFARLLTLGANDPLGNHGTDLKAADKIHHHMSNDQHANAILELEKMRDTTKDAKEKTKIEKALSRYYTANHTTHDESGSGRLDRDVKEKVDQIIRNGTVAHVDSMRTAMSNGLTDFEKKWSDLTDGQRRYVANNVKYDDPGLSGVADADKQKMFKTIAYTQESSAAEYLIKDPKTDLVVKTKIREGILESKLRTTAANILTSDPTKITMEQKKAAIKQFWLHQDTADFMTSKGVSKGDMPDATILKEVITEYTKKGDSIKDVNMAKFYNNQKRYIPGTHEQETDLKTLDPTEYNKS